MKPSFFSAEGQQRADDTHVRDGLQNTNSQAAVDVVPGRWGRGTGKEFQ